jgi:hypothetical protein
MTKRVAFQDRQEFVRELKKLLESGVSKRSIRVLTPYSVHEAEDLLRPDPSPIRYLTLSGALLGMIAGFALTIFTALSWPLITGGKPIISIPPFIIIAFELTILFGALASFAGFLIFAGLPSLKRIFEPEECMNEFVILRDDLEEKA